MSGGSQDLLSLLVFIIFIAIPAYLFVFGQGAKPLKLMYLFDREEGADQAAIFKRGFVWFVSAGAIGTLWSLALTAAFT